jgi:hypothetical protein
MIDLMQEHLVPMREVPKLLPVRPNGKPLHVSACYRWIDKGVHGTRLESVTIGGTTYTSREALQRFANHLSHPAQGAQPPGRAAHHAPPPGAKRDPVAERARHIFSPRRERAKSGAAWAPTEDATTASSGARTPLPSATAPDPSRHRAVT